VGRFCATLCATPALTLSLLALLWFVPLFAADRPEVHGEPEYKAGISKINEALSLVSVS